MLQLEGRKLAWGAKSTIPKNNEGARIWQEHITGNSEAAPAFVDARRPLTTGFLDAPSVQ